MAWTNEQFSAVFNELYPGLCRFLESLVGRTGLGQEMAQETFLRLFKNGPGEMPISEARFWVYRVGRNLAINELRRAKTWRSLSERVGDILTGKQLADADRARWSEYTPLLYRLLEELPEHQRAALLLREIEDMKYQEIARVLEVSESKVKIDIHRARIALKERAKDAITNADGRATG